jgi:hypothetical protein
MKKFLVVLGALTCLSLGSIVIAAAASGTPEVDPANATFSLTGQVVQASCTGEDGAMYATYRGGWSGTETDKTPGSTDYSLSGPAAVSGIKWTINKSTGRGVLTGTITLSTTAGTGAYKGTLILVTQGIPAVGALVPARGWINAGFVLADDGVPPPGLDDHLIANVEFMIPLSGTTSGQFGDAVTSLGFPDWSVVTNVAPKAADGLC